MTTQRIRTLNMVCASCEKRIVNGLLAQEGILSGSANYATGIVSVTFEETAISLERILEFLEELHYPAISAETAKKESKVKQWIRALLILAAVVAGYFVLEQAGVFTMFPMADQNTALPVLFVIGLLTSLHCIAMCGGINLSQCASVPAAECRKYQKLLPGLLYNCGRVISYTLIGGIVGAIGSVITPTGGLRGIVAVVAGVFMLIMGLNMLNFFPFLRKLMPKMPKFITKKVDHDKVGKGPLIVGLLNGLMPCGPLQSMQLYALSTGSFLTGALSMFLFSLGTVPLMFGLGALSSILSAKFTNTMFKVSALLVMILGLMMLNNGLSLSGLNPLF